ncbi:UNVERIFIED_ORG: hypothetical protein M2438_002694 [Methylobacterium sp. SuP10 SLI 274]|nr:hypothetical protein [Methylorubrum pseudosasae]MDH6637519.1 hypothetical protein [Methylobacterium sp. SuP10 SLI 274]MDH6666699.1 hypothetical protein [Methylorubrum zatmanii]
MLFRFGGKRREMGLGPLGSVPLGKAREMAAAAREMIAGGVDPIEARRTQPEAVAAPKIVTFGEVAEGYMADHKASWKNEQHRWQWRQTLEVQAAHVWKMPVADVTTDDVLKVLRPIWHEKPETARRLRGRIERVLSAAKANKLRTGENPAMWRGHLDMLLPKAKRLSRGHHAALSFPDVPAFVAMLRERPATTARALEFLILTAARSGEVRGIPTAFGSSRMTAWPPLPRRVRLSPNTNSASGSAWHMAGVNHSVSWSSIYPSLAVAARAASAVRARAWSMASRQDGSLSLPPSLS